MLPDFRFLLGAFLAIALLGVAGLGLVASARLLREAQMAPLDDSRRLAFAGPAGWNQFYDPDGAWRFAGLGDRSESPPEETRHEASTEEATAVAPPASGQADARTRTASLPTEGPEAQPTPLPASVVADETGPRIEAPPPDPGRAAEASSDEPTAAPPADTARLPAPEAASPHGSPAAPTAEQVASAPAPSQDAGLPQAPKAAIPAETLAAAQSKADGNPQDSTLVPKPRLKPHRRRKIVRAPIPSVIPTSEQTWQNSAFPQSTAPSWTGYDDQFNSQWGGAPGKKVTGKLTAPANRP